MLTFDFSQWEIKARAITGASNQVPFVVAVALTNAMKDVREAEKGMMAAVFDRPTRYTLNSIKVRPATKLDLTAEISFKEFPRPAWKWLGPQVNGGQRQAKAFERALRARGIMKANEFAVPGKGVALDASGNIPGSRIVQILSQLGAGQLKAGYAANMTDKSWRRALRKAGGQFFVSRGDGAPPGIYQRVGKRAVAILLFVRQPQYTARFPWYSEAERVIPPAFHRHAQDAWDRYVVKDIKRG